MDTISVIKNQILQLCTERNITINRLATLSALPPSSIKKICDGLDITLGEFFNTKEFDNLEQEIK